MSDVDDDGRSGLALVDVSVVEQRYRAVLAVQRGESKIVVAAQFGVSRQTLHTGSTTCAGFDATHPVGTLANPLVDQRVRTGCGAGRAGVIGISGSRNYGELGSYLSDRRWRAGLA
jgi:hypothetical protein